MAVTSTVRPLGLIRQLDVIIGGHTFQISVVILYLDAPGAYPLILDRPKFRTANIKRNWQKNILTFWKGKTTIRLSTQKKVATSQQCVSLYGEVVNIMEGLDGGEEHQYFEDSPKIIPLFDIDILKVLTPYLGDDEKEDEVPVDDKTLKELRLQQEAMEREMQVSQQVRALALEEFNLANNDTELKIVLIAREMQSADKARLAQLLQQYKDVFAWSFEVMKGFDPAFCQHHINMHKDAKPVQQRPYRLNPNYAVKVKEQINKLL